MTRRVLFVVRSPPHPVRGGGDLRTGAQLRIAAELGIETRVFAVVEHTTPTPNGDWLKDPMGYPTDGEWAPQTHAALRDLLAEFDPDLAILQLLFTRAGLPTLREHRCRVVLDAHNVEGQLATSLLELSQGPPSPLARLVAARTPKVEATTAAAVDTVWAVSDRDAEAFRAMSDTPVVVVPSVVAEPVTGGPRKEHEVLFAGSLSYPPNRDAVRSLLEALPLLHKDFPDATLHVAGSNPLPEYEELPYPWLTVTGAQPSFDPIFAGAGVLAIPLQVGGGTRLKAVEAFAAGLPVVSSRKGVEGLAVEDGEHVLLAESPEDVAAAIARLRRDPELRDRLVRKGKQLHELRYSDAALRDVLQAQLGAQPT